MPRGQTAHSWSPNRPSVICAGESAYQLHHKNRLFGMAIGPLLELWVQRLSHAATVASDTVKHSTAVECTGIRSAKGKQKRHTAAMFIFLKKNHRNAMLRPSVSYYSNICRGAQTPAARWSERLNFVRWHVLVSPEHWNCSTSAFRKLNFWGDYQTFGRSVRPWLCMISDPPN